MKIKPLIKYIGNKHRFAPEIVRHLPGLGGGCYYEPFLGSGAVLGHLAPRRAVACDLNQPLIEMWQLVKHQPQALASSYRDHFEKFHSDREGHYHATRAAFNAAPNPHDFLFIARTCYGGVIRFRLDGHLSTPLGAHSPIHPDEFSERLWCWHTVVQNTDFLYGDFASSITATGPHDVIYCDPPYVDSQKILYGAQRFDIERMYQTLLAAKTRGSFVAVSVDGTKKSGQRLIALSAPGDLFEMEVSIAIGASMLKRFARSGQDMQDEMVTDRLLLSGVPSGPITIIAGQPERPTPDTVLNAVKAIA